MMNGPMWLDAHDQRGHEHELIGDAAQVSWWAQRFNARGYDVLCWPSDENPDALDVAETDVGYWPAAIVDVAVGGDVL